MSWGDDVWQSRPVQDELRWYVFDDRAMYRPGEEVHVKGWLRRVGGRQDGDVSLVGDALQRRRLPGDRLPGQRAADAARRRSTPWAALTWPSPCPTTPTWATPRSSSTPGATWATWRPAQFGHSFQVQEFRRPEFEVTARNETPGPYFAGGSATVAVEAAYYAGGPLPNAEVTWQVSSSPGSYSPPNWPDFIFGRWQPWWWSWD